MKSSDPTTTKVLSATLLISLISASQAETCAIDKNNSMADIAAACAAATDGGKSVAKPPEAEPIKLVDVKSTKQEEAPVVGIEIVYPEGKYIFRSTSTGGLISKCHVLASAHAIPHPLEVTGEETRRGLPLAQTKVKANLLGAAIALINQQVKVTVALASDTDEVRFLGGKVAGIGRSKSPDFLEVADDFMVIRLDKNVGDIAPMELDGEKFTREISFSSTAISYAGYKGGFKVKQQDCKVTLTDPVSSFNEPTMVKYNCLNVPGDSGGLLISKPSQGQHSRPGVWTGMMIGENPGGFSEGGGVLISRNIAMIKEWMKENSCQN